MPVRFVTAFCVATALSGSANAGFESWTVETDTDPFSKGMTVVASYSSSIRSGAIIFCDSTGDGIRLRAIPGWAYVSELKHIKPLVQVAIDGTIFATETGVTGSVSDNLAAAEIEIKGSAGRNLIRAFAAAKKQVAIKDGISDRAQLLTSRGSTKSGNQLLHCLRRQTGWVD